MAGLIGYARTSTAEQKAGLAAQYRDLKAAGAEKIYGEHVSSVKERAGLDQAMAALKSGDTLVVTKLDRLARSIPDLLDILARLEAKGAALIILSWGGGTVDTRSAIGKLFIMMSGAFAAFERDIMLERQREGINRAKAEGKYKGKPPTVLNQTVKIRELRASGMGPTKIARALNVSRAGVYRMLGEQGQAWLAAQPQQQGPVV